MTLINLEKRLSYAKDISKTQSSYAVFIKVLEDANDDFLTGVDVLKALLK